MRTAFGASERWTADDGALRGDGGVTTPERWCDVPFEQLAIMSPIKSNSAIIGLFMSVSRFNFLMSAKIRTQGLVLCGSVPKRFGRKTQVQR